MAALYYKTDTISGQFFCAANLISENYLLTAAHCIKPKNHNVNILSENIIAVIGQYLKEQLNGTEMRYDIAQITVHPNWNSSEMRYTGDIAILRTESYIKKEFGQINHICISKSKEVNEHDFGLVAGWGDGQEGPPYEGTMRTVAIKAVTYEDCFFNAYELGKMFARKMFCAGGEREGPCMGASGESQK